MTAEALRPEDAPPAIYGPDGEPQFFQDPAMDRFVAVILNIASELWVQTERVDTLSRLLQKNGIDCSAKAAAAVAQDSEPEAEREALLQAYIGRILTPLREPRR